jgi:hypothetical protein
MIQATSGPATGIGPLPGMAKKADPKSKPQNPAQNGPSLPLASYDRRLCNSRLQARGGGYNQQSMAEAIC